VKLEQHFIPEQEVFVELIDFLLPLKTAIERSPALDECVGPIRSILEHLYKCGQEAGPHGRKQAQGSEQTNPHKRNAKAHVKKRFTPNTNTKLEEEPPAYDEVEVIDLD
jgi:hypothetical protein